MTKKSILKGLGMGLGFALLLSFNVANAQDSIPKPPKLDEKGWRQLFNGKDLSGWKMVGPGSRYVENGVTGSHGGMGLLYWTKEKFSNCTIRLVYRMQKSNSNSGVFIRIPIEPREPWMPVFYGYEVQIDNHPETS
ncbi:MAG: 3-keto-disaccharide hydrolase, partial [Mucilaginibacter sp.]